MSLLPSRGIRTDEPGNPCRPSASRADRDQRDRQRRQKCPPTLSRLLRHHDSSSFDTKALPFCALLLEEPNTARRELNADG
jgi:hypothetical protein